MATAPTLKPGMKGEAVLALQKKLASWGFDPGPLDGIFGERTRSAVVALQVTLGQQPDGIYGPATAVAITTDLARGAGSTLAQKGAASTSLTRSVVNAEQASSPSALPSASASEPATESTESGLPPWMLWGLAALGIGLVGYALFKNDGGVMSGAVGTPDAFLDEVEEDDGMVIDAEVVDRVDSDGMDGVGELDGQDEQDKDATSDDQDS